MSVQAGVWNLDGEPIDRDSLVKISHSLTEYGPDGEATYFDHSVGLLYRPFHTTSESRLEHQPHISDTGKVMTWDGRLDNRDDLIAQVHDYLLDDHSDVAIVQAAFQRWGTDCLAKLLGDWALAVWNPRDRELILARDYAGIRHLFYYAKPSKVIWCNHLAPLASCGYQFHLCDEYFSGYLAMYPEAHLTPYREIQSVKPGTFVRVRTGKISMHAYWTFDPHLKTRHKTDAEYEEHFRHLFRQAVRRRMRTDSPILADLSGGFDSSSVVCMADDIISKERGETPGLDTFSALVHDEPGDEDASYLRKVEEKRGRIGHHVEIRELGDMSPFDYSCFVAAPGANGRPELNTAKANIVKHGNYRVFLCGTGGDEMLGQALDPRVQLADLLRQLRFTELAKQLGVWSLLLRRPWMLLFLNALVLQLPASIRAWSADVAKVDPWVNSEFAHRHRFSARCLDVSEGSLTWLPSARDWFQTLMTLTRLMTTNGPCTEEKRHPYLDQTLVEFLISIPTEQLLRPGQRRSLMRRALVGLLPREILSRRTKSSGGRYFSVALEKHWYKLEDIFHAPLIARLGYIDKVEFHEAMRRAKNGNTPRYFHRLSRALCWELWLREAVARRVVSVELDGAMSLGTTFVQSSA